VLDISFGEESVLQIERKEAKTQNYVKRVFMKEPITVLPRELICESV
jgi:hypothetical protein